jgi:hypothetical protein
MNEIYFIGRNKNVVCVHLGTQFITHSLQNFPKCEFYSQDRKFSTKLHILFKRVVPIQSENKLIMNLNCIDRIV